MILKTTRSDALARALARADARRGPAVLTRRALLPLAVGASLAGVGGALAWTRRAAAETPPAMLPEAERADRLEVRKADRLLILWRGDRELARYQIALGSAPEGHKRQEGDGRTPEGRYRIDRKNPASSFHLSLGISYPDAEDRTAAARAGVSPGGDIFIHGLPNGLGAIGARHRRHDWTAGCVAVTNDEIRDVWSRVAIGAPIELKA